jgi:hypothetical protein
MEAEAFGDLNLAICGDFWQLPPVGVTPLFQCSRPQQTGTRRSGTKAQCLEMDLAFKMVQGKRTMILNACVNLSW